MSTLLLRLAAPIQSWGADSKFERRNTGRAPSKSGVIGLCAAALGYKRDDMENIKRLAALKFGVRIDRPGVLLRDFHMAHDELFWDNDDRGKINQKLPQTSKNKSSFLTIRYYLADAAFLAGLEGDDDFIRIIDDAIRAPIYPLFLGRRSCPPEGRVSLGAVSDSLFDALSKQPSVLTPYARHFNKNYTPRINIDADAIIMNVPDIAKKSYPIRDVPLSFNPHYRQFNYRNVYEADVEKMNNTVNENEHDAFAAVEEARPCT